MITILQFLNQTILQFRGLKSSFSCSQSVLASATTTTPATTRETLTRKAISPPNSCSQFRNANSTPTKLNTKAIIPMINSRKPTKVQAVFLSIFTHFIIYLFTHSTNKHPCEMLSMAQKSTKKTIFAIRKRCYLVTIRTIIKNATTHRMSA